MTRTLFTTLCTLIVFTGAQRGLPQSATVLLDEFEGNKPDAAWGWTTNDTANATIEQDGGRLIVSALSPASPGSDTWNGVIARRSFGPASDFIMTADIEWKSYSSYRAMQKLIIGLYNPADELVASVGYTDGWVDWSGGAQSWMQDVFYETGLNSLPLDGQERFSLVRSGRVITAKLGDTVLQSATLDGLVSAVEVQFAHFSSQRGSSFGELAISRLAVEGVPYVEAPVEPCKTLVGGTIANELWTKEESPYCVTNDVYVSGLLRIKEGVEVRFEGDHVFEVAGRLRADGTAEAPIQFHPTDPAVGWQGLLFRDAVPGSYFVHTIIEGSKNSGVRITNTPPALTNCVVRNNSAPTKGAGISAEVPSGNLVLAGCQITGNRTTKSDAYGGGISAVLTSGTLALDSCRVVDNQSGINGGGVYVRGSGVFTDCVISSNRLSGSANGGGGVCSPHTPLLLMNCELSANEAQYGGALYTSTSSGTALVRIFNSNILGNRATAAGGGALFEYSTHGEVVNCVFARNQPDAIQVWTENARLRLTNSIVFDNGGASAIGRHPSSITVAYSNTEGKVWPGPGNISISPALCPENFSLIEGSPCIDAGHPGLEFRDGCRSDDPCSPFARGGPRNDMGAYGGPGVAYWTQPRAEPVIRIAPENEIGFEGQPAYLGVIATGLEPLVYQWFKNDAPLAGRTNAVLTIPSVALSDVGAYYVKVSNALGETDSPSPADLAAVRLGVAKLEVRAEGSSGDRPRLLIRNGRGGTKCTVYSVSRLAVGDTLGVPGQPPDGWELRETLTFTGSEVGWTDPRALGTGEVRYYGVLRAP